MTFVQKPILSELSSACFLVDISDLPCFVGGGSWIPLGISWKWWVVHQAVFSICFWMFSCEEPLFLDDYAIEDMASIGFMTTARLATSQNSQSSSTKWQESCWQALTIIGRRVQQPGGLWRLPKIVEEWYFECACGGSRVSSAAKGKRKTPLGGKED